MKLALIPAGEFLMGSPDSDTDAQPDEKPQHPVRITRSFYLGIHEVTQGQYRAVTGDNPSNNKGPGDLPVEQVSWIEAVKFCNTLSEREGLKQFYKHGTWEPLGGEGYRLPTEAEWEYACRAGSTTRYCFGDDAAGLGEFAWFGSNSDGKTHQVGQKRPNAYGLYDMHENVSEWCGDWYAKGYYGQSPGSDPFGPSGASVRVVRGGSWNFNPQAARSANRFYYTPAFRLIGVGFRLARVPAGL